MHDGRRDNKLTVPSLRTLRPIRFGFTFLSFMPDHSDDSSTSQRQLANCFGCWLARCWCLFSFLPRRFGIDEPFHSFQSVWFCASSVPKMRSRYTSYIICAAVWWSLLTCNRAALFVIWKIGLIQQPIHGKKGSGTEKSLLTVTTCLAWQQRGSDSSVGTWE